MNFENWVNKDIKNNMNGLLAILEKLKKENKLSLLTNDVIDFLVDEATIDEYNDDEALLLRNVDNCLDFVCRLNIFLFSEEIRSNDLYTYYDEFNCMYHMFMTSFKKTYYKNYYNYREKNYLIDILINITYVIENNVNYDSLEEYNVIIINNIIAYFYSQIEKFDYDYCFLEELINNYLNNSDEFFEELGLNTLESVDYKSNFSLLRTQEVYDFFDSYIDSGRFGKYKTNKLNKNISNR